MYESGRATALSAQTIGKLCEALGLLPPTAVELQQADTRVAEVRTFCPNPECPSNLPVRLGEQVVLVPHKHFAAEGECHCGWCGEVLERACPECGGAIQPGAFCTQCGSAYVAGAPARVEPVRVEQSERLMAWSH